MNIRSALGQIIAGGLLVAIVIGTILGSVVLSINEGAIAALPIASPIPTDMFVMPPLTIVPAATDSLFETPAASTTAATTSVPGETPSPTPTVCPIPVGWQRYTVSVFDTIEGIAARFGITVAMVMQGNCLPAAILSFGQTIYVPSTAPTPTPPPCTPPAGWAVYIVRPGDTLTGLAARYGLSVVALMRANCLTATSIYVGQLLRVPYIIPYPTPTFWWWPTVTPISPTWTPFPIVTDTPFPVITDTPFPIVTDTPFPIATDTPFPIVTDTPVPAATPTPAPVTTVPPTATPALPPPPSATPPVSPLITPFR